eukprot:361679-Chlamydomonas_euryale.AAC.1
MPPVLCPLPRMARAHVRCCCCLYAGRAAVAPLVKLFGAIARTRIVSKARHSFVWTSFRDGLLKWCAQAGHGLQPAACSTSNPAGGMRCCTAPLPIRWRESACRLSTRPVMKQKTRPPASHALVVWNASVCGSVCQRHAAVLCSACAACASSVLLVQAGVVLVQCRACGCGAQPRPHARPPLLMLLPGPAPACCPQPRTPQPRPHARPPAPRLPVPCTPVPRPPAPRLPVPRPPVLRLPVPRPPVPRPLVPHVPCTGASSFPTCRS